MSNYLSPFQNWQIKKYGNALHEKPEHNEEYENRNFENREPLEFFIDEQLKADELAEQH